MPKKSFAPPEQLVDSLVRAACDKSQVMGLTHNFYRYPARFSPTFASTAIELFSAPGDLVLDPYMGGGTTIVEAMVSGRRVVGVDLNSLAIFVTKVKTSILESFEERALTAWAVDIQPQLSYRRPATYLSPLLSDSKTRNLTLPRARFIKKIIATALASIDLLPTPSSKNFARCVVLKTGQWALDGRKRHTSLSGFRIRLVQNVYQMLNELREFERQVRRHCPGRPRRKLIELAASLIDKAPIFSKQDLKVDLVVTSPPYPGIHVLYHRWQVNGRRETPAPYWIAGCEDGQGDSYYNFGSRQQPGLHSYFEKSLCTLKSIRRVMRPGGYMVQMLAFSEPQNHLPRYLNNMEMAGFKEVLLRTETTLENHNRIWRTVPNRKWHANLRGRTSGSKEVVLVHIAN